MRLTDHYSSSMSILVRTSLPRCLCENDACPPPLCLQLPSYQTYNVMYFSHLCLGFPLLLFSATIPCIIVFSKPFWRVMWPDHYTTVYRHYTTIHGGHRGSLYIMRLKGNAHRLGLKRSLSGCAKPNMHFCITLYNCLA